MTKHTPGPWAIEQFAHPYGRHEDRTITRRLANGNPFRIGRAYNIAGPEETDANARLIAAAPELLAALEIAERRIVELCRAVCVLSGNPKKARAEDYAGEIREAIKKATGQD
jgi:hypothetical protein